MNTTQKFIKACALMLAGLIILCILSSLLFAFSTVGHILGIVTDQGEQSYHNPDNVELVELEDDFVQTEVDFLEIDVKTVGVKVIWGDELKLETNSDRIEGRISNGGLYVREKEFNFFHGDAWDDGEVIISLPSKKLRRVEVDAGAGRVELRDVSVDELSLDLGAGKAELSKLTVSNKAQIKGGAGSIELKQSKLRNLDFDMGAGKAVIEAELDGETEVDAGVGKLELVLLGNANDYRVKVDKGLGSVKINGQDAEMWGNGNKVVDIDGGVGAIEIKIEDRDL